jgi:hypoxanthine-guanine phosphoribosyltransferase
MVEGSLEGRHLLLVEDMVESGHTASPRVQLAGFPSRLMPR